MLKRCRKMIINRVPGVFEKDCFSDEEILFKTENCMLHQIDQCFENNLVTLLQCYCKKGQLFKNCTWI